MKPRIVTLIHAYSSGNSGDGLLVREAKALVEESIRDCEVHALSLDPDSFTEILALHPLTGSKQGHRKHLAMLKGVARHRLDREARELLGESDLIVAVGGGYMRAGRPVEALKSWAAHGPQMPNPESTTPYVYLPQSFGPFRFRSSLREMRKLRSAKLVYCRDDRSLNELKALGIDAFRAPDLAVLAISTSSFAPPTLPVGREFALVARSLGRRSTSSYVSAIKTLADSSNSLLATQSVGRGNDDQKFYESVGYHRQAPLLHTVLAQESRPFATVSVRLHGALESILQGVPAIHLSYERKGWGAFEDLNLLPFVHNARDPHLSIIHEQLQLLQNDASAYWDRVNAALPSLKEQRRHLIQDLTSVLE